MKIKNTPIHQRVTDLEFENFIKEWIDNCENIIKKNKTAQQELRKQGRSAEWDAAYNEKIINQISIKNVYVSKDWADYVGKAKPDASNPHSDLYDPSKSSHGHDSTNPDNYMPVSLYTKKKIEIEKLMEKF